MMHLAGVLYAIGCGIVFAGVGIAGKIMSPEVPALLKVFMRFFVGGLVLAAFVSWKELRQLSKKRLAHLAFMGFIAVILFNVLFFSSLSYISVMTSSLIMSAQPIVTLFITSLIARHIPSLKIQLSFLLAFIGVALVITHGQVGWDVLTGNVGEFLMIIALLCQVGYVLLLRSISTHVSSTHISFVVAVSGILFLIPLMFGTNSFSSIMSFTATDWWCAAYLGAGGGTLGLVLFNLGIVRLGAAQGSLVIFSTLSLVTLLWSVLVGHAVTSWEAMGTVFVLVGLIIGLKK